MYYPFTKKTKDKFKIVTTSGYGYRWGSFHDGIDYAPSKDRNGDIEIIASVSGNLISGRDKNGGLWSYVKGYDGRGYLTVHHKRYIKTSGKVKAGDVIALMGTTGNSTGVHTHFETRSNYNNPLTSVDPESLNLKYYDTNTMPTRQELLQQAEAWNDLIQAKNLTVEDVEPIVKNGNPSKLLNKLGTKDREDLLIKLKDLTDWLQSSSLKNTGELDEVLLRYALYANRSSAI